MSTDPMMCRTQDCSELATRVWASAAVPTLTGRYEPHNEEARVDVLG